MIKVYTKWDRPEKKYDPHSDEIIVERAGYIPPKLQVEQMFIAGERLAKHRKEMYDFSDESKVNMEFSDPTRTPGFDLVDATRSLLELEAKANQIKENIKRAKEAETADKVTEGNKQDSESKVTSKSVSKDENNDG